MSFTPETVIERLRAALTLSRRDTEWGTYCSCLSPCHCLGRDIGQVVDLSDLVKKLEQQRNQFANFVEEDVII